MVRTMGKRVEVKPSQNRTAVARSRARRRNERIFASLADVFSTQPAGASETQSRPQVRRRSTQLRIDVPLLLAVITLVIFGLLMLYSASYDYSLLIYGNPGQIFSRQLLWLGVGICGAVVLAFIDYHFWRRLSVWVMGITLVMLLGVLFIGDVRNGAARTLYGGSIQPSELAKLVIIIYLSVWLYTKSERLSDIKFGLIPLAGILGILGGMIAAQPDLSAVLTVIFLGGLMFFLAGGDLRQIGVLLLIALLVGWIVVGLTATGSTRLQDYMAGLKDPMQGSYHVQRAFEAFVRGGWFGVGLGRAETKLTGLPVPPTDSVFAVVGEEVGTVGAIFLVGLYSLLLWRGLVIAQRAPDQLGSLLAAGLSIWVSTEAFINMSVIVNLLPFAGNALPFISAGGSNLVVSLAAVGILLNVSRLSVRREEENGWFNRAVVNLRGWDRRRSVSRPGRPSVDQG